MSNSIDDGSKRNRRKERKAGDSVWMTANDRFKRDYSNWVWLGVLSATFLHFALFNWFPQLQAADLGSIADEIISVDLPPEVKIPPPPEQIARPATPRVSASVDMDSMLREAGISGQVTLWVFVDESGNAAKSQVQKSSGYPAFDNAATQIVDQMEFSPAMNRDKPVGVWVAQRIDFTVNG